MFTFPSPHFKEKTLKLRKLEWICGSHQEPWLDLPDICSSDSALR